MARTRIEYERGDKVRINRRTDDRSWLSHYDRRTGVVKDVNDTEYCAYSGDRRYKTPDRACVVVDGLSKYGEWFDFNELIRKEA